MRSFNYTEEEYRDLEESDAGLCVQCGEEQGPVEPDAVRYKCDICGAKAVYGMSELLLMGQINITESITEDAYGDF